MTSVGGAGEENSRPATACLRSAGPGCPDQEVAEGYREGARMEAPEGRLGQMAVEGEAKEAVCFLEKYQGGVSAPEESSRRRGMRKGRRRLAQAMKGKADRAYRMSDFL